MGYENQMAVHTSTHKEDFSLAREYPKILSDVSL